MRDANGSHFALLLGRDDWAGCTLVDDADADAAPRTLGQWWADAARRSEIPLEFDTEQAALHLARRISRFRAAASDVLPDMARRLGAAADGAGNVYAIADGGLRIDVRSAGSRATSVFWDLRAPAAPAPPAGGFGPLAAALPPAPRRLRGLAVTTLHYLVAGVLPEDGRPAGMLVFDLRSGGAPLALDWPRAWPFTPHDMAARPGGGLAVLDRERRRVWLLDRRLGMGAPFPVEADDASRPDDFAAPFEASPAAAAPPAPPWFDLALDALGGADPVSIETLSDELVIVMDRAGSDGFALLSVYDCGALAGRASTAGAAAIIDHDEAEGFVLRGFDCALQARSGDAPPRLVIASDEGNQCIAFDLFLGGSPALQLDPVERFLPMRRFGGMGLARLGAPRLAGDTGLVYDSRAAWLPLVEQRRARYAPLAALVTPALDGREPGCVWHRFVVDGCLPAGTQLRIATRAADRAEDLAALPWRDEPLPALRPDGSELPWLQDAPGAVTDPAQGEGSWELLFQRAAGRFLQLRLTLAGDELATPRLVALRAWFPRFSYAQRYLPALYREDAGSADFLERFLANFEGLFTSLEDRIAAAAALFDVRSAHADTLDWLGGWLGLVLDPALPPARRRALIEHAVTMYRYRGTTQGVRLAVRLALPGCVRDEDFVLPAPSQRQPFGVRIVERYLTRTLPRALLGETVIEQPREIVVGPRWSTGEGAAGLTKRWRDWLAAEGVADAASAVFRPVAPEQHSDAWRGFCLAQLGAVPQLAEALRAAWQGFVAGGKAAGLGPDLPAVWPEPAAQRQAWRDFIAKELDGGLRRWLARWQGFVARRHRRIDDYRSDTGLNWPDFGLIPAPDRLPGGQSALDDWALFETRLEPMARAAHRFSVLLPSSGPLADAASLAQEIQLAERVVRLEKPAHTVFDVRQYWALFRIGQARLGMDSLLGQGSRAPELAPPIVVGAGQVGAGRLALRPQVPADRILLEC